MKSEQFDESLRSTAKEPVTVDEILSRGVDKILPDKDGLRRKLKTDRVRLYLGIDPTSPDLHIGHSVPLRKLRQFQEAGHEVVLLFGDFTALIGDPSDKSAARVRLTNEQVAQNMKTYVGQAARVLDVSPSASNPITLRRNSEWLSKLTLAEVIDIQANFSVQQMLERSMFQKRLAEQKPIWLQEFSYPWMQGYDAQAMDVDVEVGGKDQLFNMLVGQELVRRYNKHEKWVVGTKLIEDPSGKKMGKTEGNIVNIMDWPEIKYEAIMSWPDSAIGMGFELITSVPMELVYRVQEDLAKNPDNEYNPMDLKKDLAYRVVAELDGVSEAQYAEEEFTRVKKDKELPRRIKKLEIKRGAKLSSILIDSGIVKTDSEALKLLSQGAVFVDGKPVRVNATWNSNESLVQIGARPIKNIRQIITR